MGKKLLIGLSLAVGVSLAYAGVEVTADHPDAMYRCGETAVLSVRVTADDGSLLPTGRVSAVVDNFGTATQAERTFDLSSGNPFTVEGALAEPGFLRLTLKGAGVKGTFAWSVGYEPNRIRPVTEVPADFDAFWSSARERLAREVPLDAQMTRVEERSTAQFDFYRISFATFGRRVHGYMSVPTDTSSAPYPVCLQVSAAGFGGWTNDMQGSPDRINVFFGVYPFEPHWDWQRLGLKAQYDEMNRELAEKYACSLYSTAGFGVSREDCFYYPVILGIDRAIDWIAARPEADARRIVYQGTSQGGGMGLILTGLNKRISRAAFFVPAMTDAIAGTAGRQSGWPQPIEGQKTETGKIRAREVMPYFDGVSFATRITCPVRFAVGLADMTCAPHCTWGAYNAIASDDKDIVYGIGMGHGCRGDFYRQLHAWLLADAAETGVRRLEVPPAGERRVVTIDPKGAAQTVVAFSVPISDIQQMWTPDLAQPLTGRKWWITKESAPQKDVPCVAFFNMAETNRFFFGSSSLGWDNRLVSRINQERGVYEITLTVAAGEGHVLTPFEVTLDRRAVRWTESVGAWRDALAYGKGPYPDGAWKPVYCSWYAAHAAISQDWTERQAKIAADLGFGTFILDDGWSYDESKRVNPVTIKTWYRDVGQWDAFSRVKFPDFKAHRERMRALGLNYIVWVAPYFLGTRSEAFRRWGFDKRPDAVPFEGNVLTDIENREMMDSVTDQLVRLLKESDLDGLKIDFIDYIRPSVDKPRGARSLEYVTELMTRLREIKPAGIFEFRQSYATPITASLATQFRAGDVPFEWLANIVSLAQIRLTMGDGVPIHADPIYWSETETEDNVARHFLAAMAGVPMLSMDLERLTASRRETVQRYMRLYEERVVRFHRKGHWEVFYRNGSLVGLKSVLPDEALVLVVDPASAPELFADLGARRLTVLNLGYRTVTLPDGKTVSPATYVF